MPVVARAVGRDEAWHGCNGLRTQRGATSALTWQAARGAVARGGLEPQATCAARRAGQIRAPARGREPPARGPIPRATTTAPERRSESSSSCVWSCRPSTATNRQAALGDITGADSARAPARRQPAPPTAAPDQPGITTLGLHRSSWSTTRSHSPYGRPLSSRFAGQSGRTHTSSSWHSKSTALEASRA